MGTKAGLSVEVLFLARNIVVGIRLAAMSRGAMLLRHGHGIEHPSSRASAHPTPTRDGRSECWRVPTVGRWCVVRPDKLGACAQMRRRSCELWIGIARDPQAMRAGEWLLGDMEN